MVIAQIDAVVRDIGVDAIKIGMIGSAETANAVADYLAASSFANASSSPRKRGPSSYPESHEEAPEMGPRPSTSLRSALRGGDEESDVPVIFDPVMVATSGAPLADADTIVAFARLMRLATLTTPNLPELAALGGEAAVLATGTALLVKGGHGAGDTIEDRLVTPAGASLFANPRIDTRHTHGTGCTLASAIATGLGAGLPLADAVARGIAYVRAALANAPGLGAGHGPMGHALGTTPFDLIEANRA
ncbi:hydroxymethylpyrimidine/phosphomethylpyrimidine kinase [Sphingomonas koreensis]|nr:hydroxymethylpyrimidine/phosphomethylpyrimidine kinase [Sphingomonas koreensis]